MRLEILISCMNETDDKIIEKSNIKSDVVIVNQCDKSSINEYKYNDFNVKYINTPTRGLSISRNLAIFNSTADICLISDDDLLFLEDYEKIIIDTFEKYPNADIIAFKLHTKKSCRKVKKIRKLSTMKISSVQVAFRRNKIIDNHIEFNASLGAGTSNGAGEENKFLVDCLKHGLKIYYVPIEVINLLPSESSWFKGYDKEYFYKKGYVTRYIYGYLISFLYAFYLPVFNKMVRKEISVFTAVKWTLKGIFSNKLR